MKRFGEYVTRRSLGFLMDGAAADPTRKLILGDGFFTGNDHERLRKYVYHISLTLSHSQLKLHRTFKQTLSLGDR